MFKLDQNNIEYKIHTDLHSADKYYLDLQNFKFQFKEFLIKLTLSI